MINRLFYIFIKCYDIENMYIIYLFRSKRVCNVAPIAGETKVWQYITLMKKIYLIDCPGVVPAGRETDTEKVGYINLIHLLSWSSAYRQRD